MTAERRQHEHLKGEEAYMAANNNLWVDGWKKKSWSLIMATA
jgi:hypothetical protein